MAAQVPRRVQTPTWPGSKSPPPPAVYFFPVWNSREGGWGGENSMRRGMTDRMGAVARGRAQPSRPGLSLTTALASPATQAPHAGLGPEGQWNFPFRSRSGEGIGGAIHLDS